MISLWPAGISSNPQGTIEWSGGLINWNSQYMKNGYYYAMVNSVTVECYDPPTGANIQGSKAYEYTDKAATNNTVEETNNMVVLGSLQANGNDPGFGASSSSGSTPKSTSSNSATNTPESVPGESGIGAMGDSGDSGSGSGSGTASAGSASTSAASGFSQGTGSTGKSEGDKISARVGGSVFAVLVAVAAALSL